MEEPAPVGAGNGLEGRQALGRATTTEIAPPGATAKPALPAYAADRAARLHALLSLLVARQRGEA